MTARDDSGASIRSALTLAIAGQSRHVGRFHRGCSKSSRAGVSLAPVETRAFQGAGPLRLASVSTAAHIGLTVKRAASIAVRRSAAFVETGYRSGAATGTALASTPSGIALG
jgi:hypothetical protein